MLVMLFVTLRLFINLIALGKAKIAYRKNSKHWDMYV